MLYIYMHVADNLIKSSSEIFGGKAEKFGDFWQVDLRIPKQNGGHFGWKSAHELNKYIAIKKKMQLV